MRVFLLLIPASLALYGQTSDPPKRTLFDSNAQGMKKVDPPPAEATRPARPAPDSGRAASSSALDALISSTENLNAIRDSNVRKLSGEGCAPDVAVRVGDLRAKLGIVAAAPAERKPAGSDSSALILAANWFKGGNEGPTVANPQRQNDLLDSVLPGSENASQSGRLDDRERASLKAELDRLLATCSGTKAPREHP